jgi:photosystem II stability/assembly factor-like uncharacterized protein
MAISPVVGGPTYIAVGGAVYFTPDPNSGLWQRSQNLPALTVNDIAVDPIDANIAYTGVHLPNQWAIFQTANGGKTWRPTDSPFNIDDRYFNDVTSIDVVNVEGQSIIYAGTNICGIVYSRDGAKTWEILGRQNCILDDNEPKNVIDLTVASHSSAALFVAADRSKVYMSADRGQTWEQTELNIAGAINGIEADFMIKDRVYLIAGSEGFWRSDNRGETWQSYSEGLEGKALVALVMSDLAETLYVASSDGEVWQTSDGGHRWISIREELTATNISFLAYDKRRQELYLGTWQDGLYKFQPGSIGSIWH